MQVNHGRQFIGRLLYKSDLLSSLNQICHQQNIRLAVFSVLGAVETVRLGYYNQNTHKYIESVRLDDKLEIISCLGNVSLKGGEIAVHAHLVLASDKGECFGGHLIPGTILFAGEYFIQELTGPELSRGYDQQTGLFLWPEPAT